MQNHYRAGFTLLEMAIVLIIFGIVLGAAMPSLMQFRNQSQIKETKAKQEIIMQAVAAYGVLHNTLPCPARANASEARKGMSDEMCADTQSAIGVVPYYTLGLTEAEAKDGFGRLMTYVVPPHLNHQRAELGSQDGEASICRLKSMAHIWIKDKNNRVLGIKWDAGAPDPSDFVAVLVISQGSSLGRELSSFERTNLDASLNFYDLAWGVKSGSFGHIIKWATLRNLMALYGRQPCKAAGRPTAHEAEPLNPSPLADPFGRSN